MTPHILLPAKDAARVWPHIGTVNRHPWGGFRERVVRFLAIDTDTGPDNGYLVRVEFGGPDRAGYPDADFADLFGADAEIVYGPAAR